MAKTPDGGYEKSFRQSAFALKYIKWWMHKNGYDAKDVRFCDHPEHEKEIPYKGTGGSKKFYRLDMFIPNDKRKVNMDKDFGLEFNGCYWHGCRKCVKNENTMIGHKTAKLRRYETDMREKYLRRKMDLEVVWECEAREQLKTDPDMMQFF
jgi:hypothetical protein